MSHYDDSSKYGFQSREVVAIPDATQVRTSDLLPSGGGILSTAQNNAGHPTGQLSADTSVMVDGVRTSLAVAEIMGRVRRDANGTYTEVARQEPQQGAPDQRAQEQQEQQDQTGDEPVPFSPQDEAVATAFAAQLPVSVQDAVIAQVISGGIDNLDLRTASGVGMSPDDFRGGVASFARCFQHQADNFVSARGVPPEDFYQWAREASPAELQDAMHKHVYGRNPKAYGPLVERYFRSVAPEAGAMQRGGYRTETTKDGEQLVIVNGVQMSAAVAAKLGLI